MTGNVNLVNASEGILYNAEFVKNYNQNMAIIPQFCMQQGWMNGSGQCVFTIVEDDAQATSRSRTGTIAYGNPNQSTVTVTLTESIGAERIDNFSAFKSSVDARRVMYERVSGAIGRDVDSKILAELDLRSTLHNGGTAVTVDLAGISSLVRSFRQNTFGGKGDVTCLVTDAFLLGLENIPQVSSSDYAEIKMPSGNRAFRWRGINWVAHERLSGRGTTAAKCFMFHRNAVAYKSNGEPSMITDFDRKDLFYFCNAQIWDASRVLLPLGVLQFVSNDQAAYVNHNQVIVSP